MSDDILGGDVAEMRRVAGVFKTKHSDLQGVLDAVSSKITGTSQWKGRDADAFRNDWKNKFAAKVRDAQAELKTAQGNLESNATQQDDAQRAL